MTRRVVTTRVSTRTSQEERGWKSMSEYRRRAVPFVWVDLLWGRSFVVRGSVGNGG
jgi:hypothetical protein